MENKERKVEIGRVQADTNADVEKFLNELYETYEDVEILGISESLNKHNVFYKVGQKRRESKK